MANFTAIPFLNERCSHMVTVKEDRLLLQFSKCIYEITIRKDLLSRFAQRWLKSSDLKPGQCSFYY